MPATIRFLCRYALHDGSRGALLLAAASSCDAIVAAIDRFGLRLHSCSVRPSAGACVAAAAIAAAALAGCGGSEPPADPAFAWCETFVGPLTTGEQQVCTSHGYPPHDATTIPGHCSASEPSPCQ